VRAPGEAFALYVHVPFCDVRCPYCHFTCFVNRDPDLPLRWAEAVARAFARRGPRFAGPVASVYFGGGTPTALDPPARRRICRWLGEEVAPHLVEGAELTVEANPESLWPESLEPWVEAGVNRLSLGLQSMDEAVLRFLGRLNSPASNRRALDLAASRVDNVSCDLILAAPEGGWEATRRSLEAVEDARVDHVSAYLLEIHPGTRFGRDVAAGRWAPRPDDDQARLYLRAVEHLAAAGFEHYEVSNFARAGRLSRHNAAYWSGAPYLGLGPSAHSFARRRRWWQEKDTRVWCAKVEAEGDGTVGAEELDAEALRDEALLLGLRTREGVAASLLAGQRALWEALAGEGLAEPWGERLRLTPRGWLVLDPLAARLAAHPPAAKS